jgi:hypothetical protein
MLVCSTPARRRSNLHWPSNVIDLLLNDEDLPRHDGTGERIDWRAAITAHPDLLSSYSQTQLAAKSVAGACHQRTSSIHTCKTAHFLVWCVTVGQAQEFDAGAQAHGHAAHPPLARAGGREGLRLCVGRAVARALRQLPTHFVGGRTAHRRAERMGAGHTHGHEPQRLVPHRFGLCPALLVCC